jgi:ABC-type transport system involved in multi-copper enzyme maturation permease subunit
MAEPAPLPPRPRVSHAPRGITLVGPLYYYDLMRLARRGRSILLRCTYALALLAGLFVAYYSRFPTVDLLSHPLDPPASVLPWQMAALAEGFVHSILVVQTIAIFILTPAYLAGAVAEEKERGTLELLFTTHVSDREIVLGKLASRLTHLAGVVLAGVPLLMMTLLWGGVDVRLLLAAFYATALNLLSVGAICIFCSVNSRTVTGAMLASYALTALFFGITWSIPGSEVVHPAGLFATLADSFAPMTPVPTLTPRGRMLAFGGPVRPVVPRPFRLGFAEALFICTFLNGFAALLAAVVAVASLRPAARIRPLGLAPMSSGGRRPVPLAAEGWGPFEPAAASPGPPGKLPEVGRWPLLWKETLHGRKGVLAFYRPLLALLAGVLFMALFSDEAAALVEQMRAFFPGIAILATAGGWCMAVGFRAAAGVSRERDKATLEGLLTLPVSRDAILGAKWLGPIISGRLFGTLLAGVVFIGVLNRSLHPLGAVLLFMAVAAHLAFLASVGVLLSVASRTTLWARVTMALIVLAFLGIGLRVLFIDVRANSNMLLGSVPGAKQVIVDWDRLPWQEYIVEVAANIPETWWFFTLIPSDLDQAIKAGGLRFAGRLIVAEAGILAYALAARVLWGIACARFRGEQRR